MRVAFNGWFSGQTVGSGQYTDRLVDALRALAPSGDEVEAYQLIATARRNAFAKLAFEQCWFPRTAAHFGCDLSHVPYWAPPLVSALPVVVTVHDLIPLLLPDYRRDLRVRAYTRLVATTTARAAAVIADSAHTAKDIATHLKVPDDRIHVIPLGVDLPSLELLAQSRPVPLLTRYLLPPRFGLYLGGFDSRKNLVTLFAAWRDVFAATRVPLVVAGRLPALGDPLAPHPADLVRLTGLTPDAIHFTGPILEADKPALLATASVFAFPSRYEGFGLPPLEAMAAATPVVASNAASLPEVLGNAGLLVSPDDVSAWSRALTEILVDPDLSAQLSLAARHRAATFTWPRTAHLTREVYHSVLAGR